MTERKRASGARRSLADAAAPSTRPGRRNDDSAAPAVEVPTESAAPAVEPPAPPRAEPAPSPRPGTKYTAQLDDDTVDAFEGLTRVARRRLGRHVDKIEVLRALLLLAADDTSLRDQVVTAIGDRPPRS